MSPYEEKRLSKFLKAFPIPLHHKQPGDYSNPWVFWREYEEGCGNDSSKSADVGTAMIRNKIMSAFSNTRLSHYWRYFLAQFWAPVTIEGSRVLSTSAQPFAVDHLNKEFAKYRQHSAEYKYSIDVNKSENEAGEHMIISGGPATAFLNRLPYIYNLQWIPSNDNDVELNYSIMLPVYFSSQSHCFGVLEITMGRGYLSRWHAVLKIIEGLKKAGMDVSCAQHIPYKSINGLKTAKDEIEEALKIVCATHNLPLAQVWIAYEDKSHIPFLSSLKDSPKKAVKLGGYLSYEFDEYNMYYKMCDVIPQGTGNKLAQKTLQDYDSRYIFKLQNDILVNWEQRDFKKSGALAICLRSNETGDFDYVLEFIWDRHLKSEYVTLLEGILLTVKGCLPRFKFASGADLGDEVTVINAGKKSTRSKASDIRIFQGKRSSPLAKELEKGAELSDALSVIDAKKSKQSETNNFMISQEKTSSSMLKELEKGAELGEKCDVTNRKTSNFMILQGKTLPLPKELEKGKKPNEVKCKIIELPQAVTQKQFGKPMKEAAENLNVSISTSKRKCRDHGILERQGLPSSRKRKENDSPIIHINTNEEDGNGAIHDVLTINMNKNTLTIKAEYVDDIVKIHLPVSQATFVAVEEKIGMKLKLSVGTYKLKYHDEDGDWILLTSDEDLLDCIRSVRKSDRTVIRLRVLLCPQQTHGPHGSC